MRHCATSHPDPDLLGPDNIAFPKRNPETRLDNVCNVDSWTGLQQREIPDMTG